MSYYLPYEIQSQMMKRLPVKSLVRFKSVSKAWKSFILSSEFIADYNAWNSKHCLLIPCIDNNRKEKYELIVDDDTFPLRKLSHTIPSSINRITTKLDMSGSSQGLFCYYGFTDDGYSNQMAVIWNTSVPKSVDIVVPYEDDANYRSVVGFGMCPRTFDPMLVKITSIKTVDSPHYNDTSEDDDMQDEDDDMQDEEDIQVEVFTLSSGAWKSLSTNLPDESIRCTQNSVDLDGFIYWPAYNKYERKTNYMIMSFDMTSEKFTEIRLPNGSLAYSYLTISKRMGSLVVLHGFYVAQKEVYNVWMMEGGVEKSFTKLFRIEAPEASIKSVLGFRKSGEPIISMRMGNGPNPDKLGAYLYEPNSRDISYIGISAYPYSSLASSYTDTLLLLDR